jgi:hypothetical protein
MKRLPFVAGMLLAGAVLFPAPAAAWKGIPIEFDRMLDESDVIVYGEVADPWSTEIAIVKVKRVIKGEAPAVLTIKLLAAETDGVDAIQFPGADYLFFLKKSGEEYLPTCPGYSYWRVHGTSDKRVAMPIDRLFPFEKQGIALRIPTDLVRNIEFEVVAPAIGPAEMIDYLNTARHPPLDRLIGDSEVIVQAKVTEAGQTPSDRSQGGMWVGLAVIAPHKGNPGSSFKIQFPPNSQPVVGDEYLVFLKQRSDGAYVSPYGDPANPLIRVHWDSLWAMYRAKDGRAMVPQASKSFLRTEWARRLMVISTFKVWAKGMKLDDIESYMKMYRPVAAAE